jgi:hypothetical protein
MRRTTDRVPAPERVCASARTAGGVIIASAWGCEHRGLVEGEEEDS